MQYCTKCRHLTEDKLTSCSNCKRSRNLRQVRDNDLVFLLTCHKYEAEEIDYLFEEHGVKHSLENFELGVVQSPFDARSLKDDQNIYVEYGDIDAAHEILVQHDEEKQAEVVPDTMPKGKRIALDIIAILAFMIIVTLVVIASDTVANGLVNFFKSFKSVISLDKGVFLWLATL